MFSTFYIICTSKVIESKCFQLLTKQTNKQKSAKSFLVPVKMDSTALLSWF